MGQDAVQFPYFFGWVGWLVELLENLDIKLLSNQVLVEVEVEVRDKLCKKIHMTKTNISSHVHEC